jgi:hypothetical protein
MVIRSDPPTLGGAVLSPRQQKARLHACPLALVVLGRHETCTSAIRRDAQPIVDELLREVMTEMSGHGFLLAGVK